MGLFGRIRARRQARQCENYGPAYTQCTPRVQTSGSQRVSRSDSFQPSVQTLDNLRISNPVESQKNTYDRVITFDVPEGQDPDINYSGRFNKNSYFKGWNGFNPNDISINNPAVYMKRETKNGRDHYIIGVKQGVKVNFKIGGNEINYDAPLTSTPPAVATTGTTDTPAATSSTPAVVENPPVKETDEPETTTDKVETARETHEDAVSEQAKLLRASFLDFIHKAPAFAKGHFEKIFLELDQGFGDGFKDPLKLEQASIQLKYLGYKAALHTDKSNGGHGERLDNLAQSLRDGAAAMRNQNEQNITITNVTHHDGTRRSDYTYEIVTGSPGKVRAIVRGGPSWLDPTKVQEDLTNLMEKVDGSKESWEALDKALKYMAVNGLTVEFKE